MTRITRIREDENPRGRESENPRERLEEDENAELPYSMEIAWGLTGNWLEIDWKLEKTLTLHTPCASSCGFLLKCIN